jgi:hypothetical protein
MLERLSAKGRREFTRHGEPGGGVMSPPSGETGDGGVVVVTGMDKETPDSAGTGVEVLVVAPDGEICMVDNRTNWAFDRKRY